MSARGTRSFRAMGCEVTVAGATPRELRAIARLFAERERTFSRFVPDSELNRVNAASGRVVRVSSAFAGMLALALTAARETRGLVDPSLGGALVGAGYDADFECLRDDGRPPEPGVPGRWRSIRLAGRQLLAPAGTQLDLNGVVKGKTVDDALDLMRGDGFVSAGGDLATRGGTVVALPGCGTVLLGRGALATSGRDVRRWVRGGRVQHHLIDPRTGEPSRSSWRQATACGLTCVGADVAAKAGFLLGEAGPSFLDAVGVPGRFVAEDGTVVTTGRWRALVEREPACT